MKPPACRHVSGCLGKACRRTSGAFLGGTALLLLFSFLFYQTPVLPVAVRLLDCMIAPVAL